MEKIVLIFLGSLSFFAVAFAVKVIYDMFFNKNKLYAHFIYKDKTSVRIKLRNVVDKISFKDIDYEYEDKLTVIQRRRKNIYYIYGNPKPIKFNGTNNTGLNVEDLQTILRSNLIKQLFEDDKKISMETMLILGAVILCGVAVIGVVVYLLKQGVSLSEDSVKVLGEQLYNKIIGV